MEIHEIKVKLTLKEVLSHYGLKPDKHLRLNCPFHNDKIPSMQVYYKTQTAYCFSSNCKTNGKSMDVIDFVMHKENQSKEDKKVLQKILQNQTFAEPEENSEASAIFYYHADHLGSNEIITDNTGAPHEFHLTLPFGETMAEQRKPVADYYNSWKFTGKELDGETGLYYFGARYYQPSWSVWLSIDPLAEKFPHQSPYVFTNNNPINFIDPDGRAAVSLNSPDNEYDVDKKTGTITKVSNKGGNETDYYNVGTTNAEGEFQTDQTLTVDRGEGTINSFRFQETENSTTSTFNIPENETEGYILEPAGPSTTTRNQDQRIPEGSYDLEDYSSAKYPNNFRLSNDDVPKDRYILIHAGNYPSNTEGCLMPGTTQGTDFVGSSAKKFGEMRTYIKKQGAENVKLNIFNIIK